MTAPDPTIEAARDLLDESLTELRKAVYGCTAEALNRQPIPGETNGLGVIVTHAMHSTRAWLSLAVGAPLPERDRPAEFEVVVDDADAFVVWLDGISAECRGLLDGDVAFDPAAVRTASWRAFGDPDEPVSTAWALLHALEHLREHVGHAQLTRQIVQT